MSTLIRSTLALCTALAACGGEESLSASDGHNHTHTHPAQPDLALLDASVTSELGDTGTPDAGFSWRLPKGFPPPPTPADNPMTLEKIEAGRHVFYDKRLSDNQTFSCASCHKQELAFAEPLPVSKGSTGEVNTRGAMSLTNVAYSPTLTWANPLQTALEHQATVPIFGRAPVELGMLSPQALEQRFRGVPRYVELFGAAFPNDPEPITMDNVAKALASFERSLISGNSPHDRWQAGDKAAVSDSAKRGYELFNSEKLECFHCHTGFNFTDHVTWDKQAFVAAPYHNTGLYDIDGLGNYPAPNRGVYEQTKKERDMGLFKAPTLRNVALTAPYMHDGSIATLSEVLDHYAAGGRKRSRRTDPLLVGFELSDQERSDVLTFLESLTDQEFIHNPSFSDPWPPTP